MSRIYEETHIGSMKLKNRTKKRLLPCALILLQSLLYGFGDPISKIAYDELPVFSLLSVRYFIAFFVLCLIGGRNTLSDLKRTELRAWLPPSLFIAGCYVLGNVALTMTAATSVAFLRSLSTVMTPVLAAIIFRERYSWKHIPIQILVVVGLYLLFGAGGLTSFGIGEVLSLLTALLMACSLLFGKEAIADIRPLTLTTAQAGVSTLLAAFCALAFDGGFHLAGSSTRAWLIIVYLALGCTAAGYLLQNAALQSISAKTVALLQCACPVLTAVFSFILLGEKLTLTGLLGSAIILGCVLLEIIFADSK